MDPLGRLVHTMAVTREVQSEHNSLVNLACTFIFVLCFHFRLPGCTSLFPQQLRQGSEEQLQDCTRAQCTGPARPSTEEPTGRTNGHVQTDPAGLCCSLRIGASSSSPATLREGPELGWTAVQAWRALWIPALLLVVT